LRGADIGSALYSYTLLRNSSQTYYYSYVVYFDLEGQKIWCRYHDNHDQLCRIHGKIIIKQHPTSLAVSQLTMVPIDTVLLKNWVVLEEWMMRIVLELDVR
jgi:hypothetical protein